MPKATAVWLVDNTSLTFEQIADFCGLHPLEVKGIADGEVGAGHSRPRPGRPAARSSAARSSAARRIPRRRMKLARPAAAEVKLPKRREPRYTPLSKRQDRPDAIAWLLRHHPELSDQQICKLLGTTKTTVNAVRDRTHWKSSEIRPRDPVLLGLCNQVDLDAAVIARAGGATSSTRRSSSRRPSGRSPRSSPTERLQPARRRAGPSLRRAARSRRGIRSLRISAGGDPRQRRRGHDAEAALPRQPDEARRRRDRARPPDS